VKINFINDQIDLSIAVNSLKRAVTEVLNFLKVKTNEVSIHFVDEKRICRLHAEFFDDPSPTDCISFPIDPPGDKMGILGEVFVCPATALKYARENQLDPYDETTLYLIHGLLHLVGYDDLEEDDKKAMRKAEGMCLDAVKAKKITLRPRNAIAKKTKIKVN
jgi:probable rRNA maturation factor